MLVDMASKSGCMIQMMVSVGDATSVQVMRRMKALVNQSISLLPQERRPKISKGLAVLAAQHSAIRLPAELTHRRLWFGHVCPQRLAAKRQMHEHGRGHDYRAPEEHQLEAVRK